MLQEGGIDPRTTPREALRLYARLFRDPEDPEQLLELVDLGRAATTRYRQLSGGEKQRLGLALALVGRPELLVLDEPTAGLDPVASGVLKDRIVAERAAGRTFVLTSHISSELEELADDVAFLLDGRIAFAGPVEELLRRTRQPRLERAIAELMRRPPPPTDAPDAAAPPTVCSPLVEVA
jgi:ABC-type multidrug transport system ATPase subunit